MSALSPAEARRRADAVLSTMSSEVDKLRLVDDEAVVDLGWGYLFCWNTTAWFESRHISDAAPPGAGPILVPCSDSPPIVLTSAPSIDAQLADYAVANGLAPPPPLGW